MPSVETQLRELARYLDTEFTDVGVEELTPPGMARPIRVPGLYAPSRRRVSRWVVAVGAAVLVLLLVGGVALIARIQGGEPEPAAPIDRLLLDVEFGDIPPFRATYSVADFSERFSGDSTPAAATVEVSYGGADRGFRLDAVQGRPDLLDVTPGGLCEGGMSVWDGQLLGIYIGCEPEDELFLVESTGTDFEPLGYLGWQTLGLLTAKTSWQEFCRGVDHQELPIDTVAGRTALHIRCIGTRDDIELWVDANTGLVLRITGSRGGPGWPGDFEAVVVEYEPVFAADTFLVEAPPGIGDAKPEEPTTDEQEQLEHLQVEPAPSEPIELTAADFLRALSSIGLAEGEIAPPFTGPLLDGGTFDLTELRGQPVLVMLWADWCPPCVDSLAPFQAVADQWAGRVEFLSVLTSESTPEAASQIVLEQNFTVPVVIDLTDTLWNPLGIPSYFLLDEDGRAIGAFLGQATQENLNQMLDLLLG